MYIQTGLHTHPTRPYYTLHIHLYVTIPPDLLDLERGCPQVRLYTGATKVSFSQEYPEGQKANLVDGVLWEEGFGLLVADRWVHDDIVALLPVHRGRDAILVSKLEG